MSAQRIAIFTIDFPDPYSINYDNNQFTTLNESQSFQYRILSNIQTLSTKGVGGGTDPYGILYVPDLHSEACKKEERDHVSANATRLADLPQGKNYALIAVAPWYSAQCTIEYFTAARDAPTKAFLTYQPGHNNEKPPVLNHVSWSLQDGGNWQSANTFPTYALSSTTGAVIMEQLALYSGNLTHVPHGEELAQIANSTTDYVRLWASVSTDSGTQLPSLWVFLVIVLAILIIAVSFTSLTMHIMQRRRRNALRERVLNGEVDLEALGVKRLTVPQEVLNKLPIYTYTARNGHDGEKSPQQLPNQALNLPPSVVSETEQKTSPLTRRSSVPAMPTSGMSTSWSQPTCPICLDDFAPNETQVRELPCRHVYHPDCIDNFLLHNSSLCPMCKQSVLPKGQCPVRITNVMVRRERHISRMRARGAHDANEQPGSPPSSTTTTHPTSRSPQPGAFGSLGSRIGGAFAGRRIFSAPERTQSRPPDIEMGNTNGAPHVSEALSGLPPPARAISATPTRPATHDCTPSHNRREWARQRALVLLGNRHTPTDVEEEDTSPRWRRTLRKVFPGF